MKVLFAIGSEQTSRKVAEKYYEKFGEELEYKNVFYFKALLDEVKNNKTYDRIVIREDLEQFELKNVESLDKFIFNNIDNITDEIEDSEIIFICSDRRVKEHDKFVERLFNIGVYNTLIGDERKISSLCEYIRKPMNKKEAKRHLNINPLVSNGSISTRDDEVEEVQIMNILKYYDNIKGKKEEYIPAFDRIAEQYSRNQLKVILNFLPHDVKNEILSSDKYAYLSEGIPADRIKENTSKENKQVINKPIGKSLFGILKGNKNKENVKKQPKVIVQEQSNAQNEIETREEAIAREQAELKARAEEEALAREQNELKVKAEQEALARQQAELKARAEEEALARQQAELKVKAEQAALKAKAEQEALAREQAELKARAEQEALTRKQENNVINDIQVEIMPSVDASSSSLQAAQKAKTEQEAIARQQAELKAKAEQEAIAREQAELKAKAEQEAIARQQAELKAKAEQEAIAREQAELKAKAEQEAIAREQAELKAKAEQEAIAREQAELKAKAEQEAIARAQAELKAKAEQEAIARQQAELKAKAEQDAKKKAEHDRLEEERKKLEQEKIALEEEKRKLKQQSEHLSQNTDIVSVPRVEVNNTSYNERKIDYKKMVIFVGANKSGTTFTINAISHKLADSRVSVGVLDMTRDKSLYYIYNQDDKDLRKIANECMQKLSEGIDSYIPAERNLKIYTTVPAPMVDARRAYKNRAIIDTVRDANSLVIVDADFSTALEYYEKADEIYIVQDMDIMKMQETTLFLRELKNRSINMSKIRIIINKYVKSKLTPKMLIQGLTYYNDPQMSFVDELLDNKVQYYIIPFNVENYSRYIDGLYNNNIEYKKYTPDFLNAIEAISNDVYRRANKGNTKRRGLFG